MPIKAKRLLVFVLMLSMVGAFVIYAYNNFKINEKFYPLPLSFNPVDSSSAYDWNGSLVKIQGGFVKGKIINGNNEELLLRSLSPQPRITIRGSANGNKTYVLRLENINPVQTLARDNTEIKIVDPHTIALSVPLNADEEKTIELAPQDEKDYLEFVILGDNRDGYQTFSQIIEQINAIGPVFTIDNGDLVFGGEPNKYRLFNETVSKLQVPLYTTIGNHDVRENGRPIYTELFGPPYYSYDYRNTHFIYLDSSRGWAEKRAIPEEQYQWLENDLKNAQGKQIFVVSHIPPTDPRGTTAPNTLPDIPGVQQTPFFEKIMNDYLAYKNLDHGFPDKEEALRFENLMGKYKVDTVFMSHIHSYFSFVKDGVRYIISGGGGAELLAKDSYYHYIRVKVTGKENLLEVIQLPSPPNQLQDRYLAGIQLFAMAIYKEYTTTVWSIASIAVLMIGWMLWNTRGKWIPRLKLLGIWLVEVVKFALSKYRELKRNNK